MEPWVRSIPVTNRGALQPCPFPMRLIPHGLVPTRRHEERWVPFTRWCAERVSTHPHEREALTREVEYLIILGRSA